MTEEAVCPRDGQTAEWHNKVYGWRYINTGFSGTSKSVPVTFGDRIGCYFGINLTGRK